MRYLFYKLRKIVTIFIKVELKRLILKYFYKNLFLPFLIRQRAFFFLDSLRFKTAYNHLRKRCFLTQNPRYIFNFFKISRHTYKKLVQKTTFVGVKKSS